MEFLAVNQSAHDSADRRLIAKLSQVAPLLTRQETEDLRQGFREAMPQIIDFSSNLFGVPIAVSERQLQGVAIQGTDKMLGLLESAAGIDESADWETKLDAFLGILYESFKESVPNLPRGRELIVFFAREARRIVTPLPAWDCEPWHLSQRQVAYHQFVADLVVRCGFEAVEEVWGTCYPGLLPQLQNMVTLLIQRDHLLRALGRPLTGPVTECTQEALGWWRAVLAKSDRWTLLPESARTFIQDRLYPQAVHRLAYAPASKRLRTHLDAWRAIAADWEQWLNLPYALLRLKEGNPITFDDAARVSLHDRIKALSAEPLLAGLVCRGLDSKTVRNAFAHSSVMVLPNQGIVRFVDRGREWAVEAEGVAEEAFGMWLSNWVTFLTLPFAVDIRYQQFLSALDLKL